MRMTRDTEIIAAAVYSAEHPEAPRVMNLADLELGAAPEGAKARFEAIAEAIAAIPADVQSALSVVAQAGNEALRQREVARFFRTPQPVKIKGRVGLGWADVLEQITPFRRNGWRTKGSQLKTAL